MVVAQLTQGIDGEGAAEAIVPGFREEHLGVRHLGEWANRDNGVAGAHTHLHSFILARHPDVYEHVGLVYNLLALVGGEYVGRLGAEYAYEVALMRADGDALGKHYLLPPSAEGLELQEAFVGDHRHHEADLVHVPRQQYLGRAVAIEAVARLACHDRAEVIGHYLAVTLEQTLHYLAHRPLLAWHAVSLRQVLKHL